MEPPIFTNNRPDESKLQSMSTPLSISGYHSAQTLDDIPPVPAVRESGAAGGERDTSSAYLMVKRGVDIIASLVALIIGFVPLLLLALCVAIQSPGPVIHKRRVLAQQDWDETLGDDALQTFDAYKLRTMVADADEILRRSPHMQAAFEKDWKLENDPRITPLGHFLRTTSIDEFPQLLNVLKGEMTLIGPRMITPPELARYGANAPSLLRVKPGLTGLWQVSGRQNVPYEERVRLDMIYIASRSLSFDLRIILKTVKCVLLRQGAY